MFIQFFKDLSLNQQRVGLVLVILFCCFLLSFLVPQSKPRVLKSQIETRVPVSWEILRDVSFLDYKRSVDVRLAKPVTKDVLIQLAEDIKKTRSQKTKNTFICYFLPGMSTDGTSWATTHYRPELDVTINGFVLKGINN